jgi:hypothetical protein
MTARPPGGSRKRSRRPAGPSLGLGCRGLARPRLSPESSRRAMSAASAVRRRNGALALGGFPRPKSTATSDIRILRALRHQPPPGARSRRRLPGRGAQRRRHPVRGGHGAARRQARRRRAGPARAAAEIDTGIIPLRGAVPFTTLRGTEDQKRALGEARAPSTACRLLAHRCRSGVSAQWPLLQAKRTTFAQSELYRC